jgi:hypothetical protein
LRPVSRIAATMLRFAPVALAACAGASSSTASTQAPAPAGSPAASAGAEGPLKHAPRPTTAAITAGDLMTRLYIFADDSMLGREAGTLGGVKGTAYIAAEAQRLGLQPAGDNGTWFQNIPLVQTRVAESTSLGIKGGQALALRTDFLPLAPGQYTPFGGSRALDGIPVIYGGRLNDGMTSLTDAQVKGRFVLYDAPRAPNGTKAFQFWAGAPVYQRLANAGAAGVAIATLDITPANILGYFSGSPLTMSEDALPMDRPIGVLVTASAAEKLMGVPIDENLKAGAMGRTLAGTVGFVRQPAENPARNVVAILPGSDPALRGTYVVIGAHNDHDGITDQAVDHDSLRIVNRYLRPEGAEGEAKPRTADVEAKIRASLDSVRRLRPARRDSVMNGADDDGSGSMAMLEVAEAMAAARTKTKRSVLFVWHTAEEKGLYGSEWFTDHPTVPRDSIIAGINIDMIGRGGPNDAVPNGGMNYLQLLGSRRLSTQWGDLVERINRDKGFGFALDYTYDADAHPANYYCRSDHWNYARYGIPVVFFSTGGHQDYHMPTDEPQYIDYPHYAKVTSFVHEMATAAANLAERPVVDKPKPDPHGACRQ